MPALARMSTAAAVVAAVLTAGGAAAAGTAHPSADVADHPVKITRCPAPGPFAAIIVAPKDPTARPGVVRVAMKPIGCPPGSHVETLYGTIYVPAGDTGSGK